MSKQTKVLITGAGGFIGSHLATYLREKGFWVRGVDIKRPEFGETLADEFEILDLRRWDNCLEATRDIDEVYALAADMGGMGFISNHHAQILYNNSLINLHTLEAAKTNNVKRYLYTSSACIYPEHLQEVTDRRSQVKSFDIRTSSAKSGRTDRFRTNVESFENIAKELYARSS
jgi:nucleoside-diphosphate-sugar epimerase